MRIECFAALALAAGLVAAAPAQADDGKAVYESVCATCHGPDGSSNTPKGKALKAPNLLEQANLRGSADEVTAIVTKSVRELPKHKQVSPQVDDAQLKAVAEYVRLLVAGSAQ
jgi:mono/diheme cytochrome c family protein